LFSLGLERRVDNRETLLVLFVGYAEHLPQLVRVAKARLVESQLYSRKQN
jgi:hypothetical protein